MKKFTVILILLCLSYLLAGNFILFTFIQKSIRKEVKAKIQNELKKSDAEILKFHKKDIKNQALIRFVKEHEFAYNDCLYDIISTKIIRDSIEYTVINDKKESKLIKTFTNLNLDEILQNGGKGVPSVKFLKLENLDKIKLFTYSFIFHYQSQLLINTYQLSYTSFIQDIIDPPPDNKFNKIELL